jgi:diguanylate cyclase (GGDEF)-like protein/PAS domain S-box-containing protein
MADEMTEPKTTADCAPRLVDSLLKNVGVGVAIIKGNQVLDCNPIFGAVFGYPVEDLAGGPASCLYLSEDAYRAECEKICETLAQLDRYDADAQYRRHDGTTIWVNSVVTPLDRSDLSEGLIWVALDIDQRKKSEQALIDSEDRFHRLTDLSSDWFWEQDENFRFTHLSGGVYAKGGLQPKNFIGKTRWEVTRGVDTRDWEPHKAQLNAHQPFADLEYRILDEQGHVHWYSVSGEPWFDRHGVFKGYCGTSRDVTERKRMEALRAGQARVLEMIATGASLNDVLSDLVQVVESQADGMVGSVLLLGEDGQRVCGGVAPSLPASYIDSFIGISAAHLAGAPELHPHYSDVAAKHGFESSWTTPIGPQLGLLGAFGTHYRSRKLLGADERLLAQIASRIAGIAIERKQAEERIIRLARHDGLTGIYNRRAIMEIIQTEWSRHVRDRSPLSIVFADLDHFKNINDTFGHQAGDDVLREVAKRIVHILRPYDAFGRYGGEEFLIVLPACDAQGALEVAERVREAVGAKKILTSDVEIASSVSIGVATTSNDAANSIDQLLKRADAALYRAKAGGRNRVEFEENS